VFLDPVTEGAYKLHFFELAVRGQNTKGESHTLHGELVAVREDSGAPSGAGNRFSVVPADCLLDLPAHTAPPATLGPIDPAPASDFLKSTYQMDLRARVQEDRRHFVGVCREYLDRPFSARIAERCGHRFHSSIPDATASLFFQLTRGVLVQQA
jgi:hypothetical protein